MSANYKFSRLKQNMQANGLLLAWSWSKGLSWWWECLRSVILCIRTRISNRKGKRKLALTVEVVLVVGGLEDVVGGLEEVDGGDEEVVGGTELELDDEDPPLQG